MASSDAWNAGWALGEKLQGQKQEHKQALSDMELEGKINDLIEQKKGLQAKIPAYLDPSGKPKAGVDGQPIPEYQQLVSSLQQNARELKEVYHPDANPTAIARFGHLLTDHLGITHPSQRQRKAAAKSAQAAQQAAQEAVSSAPIGSAQQGQMDTDAQVDSWKAQADAKIQFLKDHNAPQEVIDQAVQAAGGVPLRTAKPIPGAKDYVGADGRVYRPVENADGTTSAMAMPPDYKIPPTKAVKGGVIKTKAGQSPTGWAQTWVDPTTHQIVGWNPITPSRFYTGFESNDQTTDPFGVTSSSARTTKPMPQQEVDISGFNQVQPSPDGSVAIPETPAATPPAQQPATPVGTPPSVSTPPPTANPEAMPQAKNGAAKPNLAELKTQAASMNGAPLSLDDAGHIPADVKANPQLKEAANQLLDGVDMKDLTLPARDKASAEALARQYGWGRGPYLPRELKAMQVANLFLDKVLHSNAFFKAIDEGSFAKTKIGQAAKDASKDGPWGMYWHNLAQSNLSPAESEYVALAQSLTGTIGGLSGVVRPGRPTEATINRLIQELPTVLSSQNSKVARFRIANLKAELNLALTAGVPKPTPQGSSDSSTPAPKSSNSTTNTPHGQADPARLRQLMIEHIQQGGPQ